MKKKAAEKIKKDSEILVVIGIGGSYLGARAVIEMLGDSFKINEGTEVIFAVNGGTTQISTGVDFRENATVESGFVLSNSA